MFDRQLRKNPEVLNQLKAADPKQFERFIAANADLRDHLPSDVMREKWVRRIAAIHTDVLLELLADHHPDLYKVMNTEEGRTWWGRQRRLTLGEAKAG